MDQSDRDLMLGEIHEAVKCLPELKAKVEKHDKAIWLLSGLGIFLSSVLVIVSGSWVVSLINKMKG